ncbi:MAG: ATP-binding protein [Desulfobacterales bacterium]|jgi:signal transduction histidine kinase|nr:ATP-binding protein [Desulfobacterales bacterium]
MNLNFKEKFRKNLNIQIFIFFSIVICAISTAFSIFSAFHQHKALVNGMHESGILLTKTLAYSCRIGVFSENPVLLKTPVEGAFQHEDVLEVTVFNLKGKEIFQKIHGTAKTTAHIASTGKTPPESFSQTEQPRHPPLIQIVEREKEMVFWSAVLSDSAYSVSTPLLGELGTPPSTSHNLLGYLRLTLDKSRMKRQLLFVLFNNLVIAVFFLAVGTLITFYLAQRITQPLQRLTVAAVKSGKDGIFHRLPVENQNEIGNLAKAFNSLAEVLDKQNLEKQQLEDKLWQSQKMEAIGTLAGGIAHDFNNIIGIITGFSEIAMLSTPAGSKLHGYLQEVFNAASRAKELVRQILTFSRKNKTECQPLQIGVVIKEALKMLRASLPSTIELRQSIQQDLLPVIADPIQIYQILINLCTNASHAMQAKGGVLDVRLEEVLVDETLAAAHPGLMPGNHQKLTVSDTGHGMTRSVLERIFDPFFTTKGPGEGTGMGLSVVHGIVKSHNGTIHVQSEPNKGTRFDIFFPSPAGVARVEHKPQVPVPTGAEKILLVDDEPSLVNLGYEILSSFGYQVTTRTNGIEALAIFEETPDRFDLVITDLTMPKITGLDLSGKILQIRPDIPIILCSGYSETKHHDIAKSLGIRKMITKPIIWQDLAPLIHSVLRATNE